MAGNQMGLPQLPPKDDFCQIAVETKNPPIFTTFDQTASGDLLSTVRSVIDGGNDLISFVDKNRSIARRLGIETIGIELAAMIESGGLDSVRDALEESLVMNRHTEISHEGLARLRRAEQLLADVGREMDKDLGISRSDLGRDQAPSDVPLWIPFAFFGAVAIGALLMSGSFKTQVQPQPQIAKKAPSRRK